MKVNIAKNQSLREPDTIKFAPSNASVLAPTVVDLADESRQQLVQLEKVKVALREYHAALDRREHGGIAQDKCIKAIQDALGMHWRG